MLLDEHIWIQGEAAYTIRNSSFALGRRRHDTTSVQKAQEDSQASVLRCGRLTLIHDSRIIEYIMNGLLSQLITFISPRKCLKSIFRYRSQCLIWLDTRTDQ